MEVGNGLGTQSRVWPGKRGPAVRDLVRGAAMGSRHTGRPVPICLSGRGQGCGGRTGAVTAKPKRAALYLRVSTGEQTTDNQRLALEAVCEQRGWELEKVYEDAGISGANGRDKSP